MTLHWKVEEGTETTEDQELYLIEKGKHFTELVRQKLIEQKQKSLSKAAETTVNVNKSPEIIMTPENRIKREANIGEVSPNTRVGRSHDDINKPINEIYDEFLKEKEQHQKLKGEENDEEEQSEKFEIKLPPSSNKMNDASKTKYTKKTT